MDVDEGNVLNKILNGHELEKIPPDIIKKLDSYFVEKFEEYLTSKALCETTKYKIDNVKDGFEKKIVELTSKVEDYEAKLHQSQQSANELRHELDTARREAGSLHESVNKYEIETSEYRKERNEAVDERDSLLKMIERRNIEVERLQSDILALESQLNAAINTKCEALAKLDEIQSKEVSLDYKEKRMDQEKILLNNTIKTLNDDLNRNMAELGSIRREHTLRVLALETKLNEKTEELKITNSMNAQLSETNNSLTVKAEDLASKLFSHSEEVTKMMDNYKKELIAKTKLADLYKEASDDSKNQINELSSAIVELKKLLNEATDEYGVLETKLKQIDSNHGEELEERQKKIEALQDELRHANELLKVAQDENIEHAIENLAPTAAASSRLIKSGMSLTEIYSVYVKTSEELQHEKKENSRLKIQIKSILQELEEKAPLVKKQSIDYQNLYEANAEMTQQLENLVVERVEAREELNDAIAKVNYFERENKKLKTAQSDLARQVCFLLKEVEQIRGGFASEVEQSITSDMSAEEVITKKLVTFSNIEELQAKNENLLQIVRDLSTKLEELEQGQINLQQENFTTKLETFNKRIKEFEDKEEYQTQMLSTCMQQKERYKKLYYDSLKNAGKAHQFDGSSINGGDDIQMEEDTPLASSSSISSNQEHNRDKHKMLELEEKVKDLVAQLKMIKEEYENYRKEKSTNEKMVNEQFDSMRNEIRELTSTNCRLMSASEFSTEQLKIIQKNVSAYKKQISALEERNKNYENSIVKYEQTIMHIKDEALSAQSKVARYEVTVDHLKQECQLLRDTESRLHMEREVLNRERQNQNLLLNNLEMIKASFERSETEGRMRMESRLDELTRECSALRRRLQEEQDRFRELTVHLERQTETAKQKMEDEIQQANKLRKELEQLRNENRDKSKQIDELSKKLQESLTPSLHDNPIAQANKRAREMEMKYEQTRSDLVILEKELENCKEHLKQYCNMANSSEKELKEMHDKYAQEKEKLDSELVRLKKIEIDYKTRIDELETEISLQITGAQLNSGDTTSQLHKTQLELQDVLQKLNENNRELRELRSENHNLSSNLQLAEQKYANEMIQHSTDIQAMTKLKEELHRVMELVGGTKAERDKACEILNTTTKGWEEKDRMIRAEREQLEQRIDDLNSQNAALHDQIQLLSTKLSVTAAQSTSTTNDAVPDSGSGDMEMSDSFMGKSFNEEDIKSSEQLLQIVKYLRKEKDIAVAKVDILRTETARLHSEQSVLQTKLDEAVNSLEQERTKTDVGVVTATKHAELLRKIETLNAITDSNRILREERDVLSKKVHELTDRVTKCEDELFPLQEKNRELSARSDAAAAENASLRIEATRWRQRANLLVERSNKTSPEDFKRLQSERENLAKMLTAEKELLKKTNDDLSLIKTEKARLDSELQNLTRQLNVTQEENRKFLDDVNGLKQTNARMTHEIIELKNNVLMKEDELKKLQEELNSKDAVLADAKNKEIQIRKIAKRYKDSYFELKKQEEEKDGEKTDENALSNPGGESSASISKSDADKLLQDKIIELNSQILAAQEENETLRKETEALKGCAEKEEKNKNLLKEAKTRILSLTESKNAIARELAATKLQIQNNEHNREENDLLISGLKSQFETRISRIEVQHAEQDKENKETIVRLTRENENLLLIINQLNRQLQGSKPSTSSNPTEKTSTDSPRTANVKPMAGPSGQQSATVTPWRGEPPLASIRPIQNSRTAAVLPTSQTSNIASVQGSSSTGSVTALVPPQQQVHTTGNNNSGEALSSSPTSSHTDYMPATSSAAVVVAAVPPMGSGAANAAESSQEAESIPTINNESTPNQIIITGGQQQQAVALVSPRVEGAQQNVVPPQSTAPVSNQEVNQAPSTSGTSSTTPAVISSHHQASSSNTVTTTQAAHKRPRDIEGDSSTGNNDDSDKQTQTKRPRAQGSEAFQGVSESGIEVEYQVPTSSQRDQEDDIIVVDSEDDDDGMVDEGNAEADDGPFEDDVDNGDGYEMEESYEQEQEMANYDEGEGPDIDEDNVQSDNNEVEVDDSSEVPNQSGSSVHVAPDGGSANVVISQIGSSDVPVASTQNSSETQQIQTISSGSDAPGSSTARQNSPHSRQAQASHLVLLQQGYEESGDDSIVPCTPTLYTPRRSDGFSEAVSSPHSQVPHAARFTFSEPRAIPGPSSLNVPSDGMDDTRVDLSELDDVNHRSVSNTTTPQKVESVSSETSEQSTSSGTVQQQEAVAGPSRSDAASIPEIMVTGASGEDDMENDDNATTSDAPDEDRDKETIESGDIDEGEGADGVSSEGEKAPGPEGLIVEEGREAEATQSPSSNTRSRSTRGSVSSQRRGGRNNRGNRPTPIIWQETHRGGGASGRNLQINVRNLDSGSPLRQQYQAQRTQRARRMRRPFGNNMRY